MKQIGIFEITRDSCDVVPAREDVVYWKATKGFDQSGENLAILEVVTGQVNRKHADKLKLMGLWRGVSEAVANTVDHAYMTARSDGFSGLPNTKWWMFTQLRDGVFTVAVCDLGCGYSATVNNTIPQAFLQNFLSPFKGVTTDTLSIQAAMEYGRSHTRLSERGKGSRDAVSVLESHGDGDLMVLSNRGRVAYKYSAGQEQARMPGNIGIDIRGTIVLWKLPLGALENDDDQHSS